MRSIATKLTALVSCLLISGAGAVFADEGAITAMQDQIHALNQQLAAVEKKMATMGGKPMQMPRVEGMSPEGGLFKTAKDIKVGGHIDVQYNQNLTARNNAVAGGNVGRIFDTDRGSFTVNQVELNFEREANPDGGAGFRIDLAMGEDAGVVAADGFAADNVDVQQAYIEYVQPLSFFEDSEYLPSTITVTAGRFVTLAGLEVIEPQDNWNISRTFAFGTTIPFVHTGVRVNFGLWNDYFDVTIGAVNGWGLPVDNNTGKTFESGIGYSPLENVSMYHTFYFGNENADTGPGTGGTRFLNTNAIHYDYSDKLAFMGEANFGREARASAVTASNVSWYSLAGYARYQVDEKNAVAARYEWVHDEKQFLGNRATTVQSYTLTYERQLADDLIGRAEYRLDHASGSSGAARGFASDASQQTLGFEMIYIIG